MCERERQIKRVRETDRKMRERYGQTQIDNNELVTVTVCERQSERERERVREADR